MTFIKKLARFNHSTIQYASKFKIKMLKNEIIISNQDAELFDLIQRSYMDDDLKKFSELVFSLSIYQKADIESYFRVQNSNLMKAIKGRV